MSENGKGDGKTVVDDGTRRTYETGARRSSPDGKGRYDLIPPEALRRLALVYERGADLHGDHNWRRLTKKGSA